MGERNTTPPYEEISVGGGKLDTASHMVGSEMSHPSDWVEIHRTEDEWEAKLVQTTLEAQQIRCRPLKVRSERQIALLVEQEHQVAAMELVSRIGVAITDNEMATRHEEAAELLKQRDLAAVEAAENRESVPMDAAEVTLAEREGIGSVVYVPGQGYELRAGPEPFITVPESDWEEFTDFSAQRQEFVILLRHEYPALFEWIQQEKLLAEFIRLIEMTYQEGAPVPVLSGPDETSVSDDIDTRPYNAFATLSLTVAVISLFAALFQLPWAVMVVLSLVSVVFAIIAKSQIDASEGQVKGVPMAFSAIVLACLALVLAWWLSQRPPPAEPENLPVRELIEDR